MYLNLISTVWFIALNKEGAKTYFNIIMCNTKLIRALVLTVRSNLMANLKRIKGHLN